MEGLSFYNFKKCFKIGHEIELIYEEECLSIWIFCYSDEIICNLIINQDLPNEEFKGKFCFKQKTFISFDNMVEDFLNEPFINGKSINQIEKKLCVLFNTAGE